MKNIGFALVAIGLLWAVIAFNMSTSVTSDPKTYGSGEYSVHIPSVTVNNIGLMEDRRNHLMFSGLTILVGVVLIGFGSLIGNRTTEPALRPCPKCAELIQPTASVCRYCKAELADELNHVETRLLAPMSDEELMRRFDVRREDEFYMYEDYRYERLSDALAYAKRQKAKGKELEIVTPRRIYRTVARSMIK